MISDVITERMESIREVIFCRIMNCDNPFRWWDLGLCVLTHRKNLIGRKLRSLILGAHLSLNTHFPWFINWKVGGWGGGGKQSPSENNKTCHYASTRKNVSKFPRFCAGFKFACMTRIFHWPLTSNITATHN